MVAKLMLDPAASFADGLSGPSLGKAAQVLSNRGLLHEPSIYL
jgi:hypothetical protein